jgi:hypothetical protein
MLKVKEPQTEYVYTRSLKLKAAEFAQDKILSILSLGSTLTEQAVGTVQATLALNVPCATQASLIILRRGLGNHKQKRTRSQNLKAATLNIYNILSNPRSAQRPSRTYRAGKSSNACGVLLVYILKKKGWGLCWF